MPAPFLSPAEINVNLRWLQANASPPVRYLTQLHLLKADPSGPEMAALWQTVTASPAAEHIFTRQNADGSWFSGGDWGPAAALQQTGKGYTITTPKFVTTAWILPFLGDLGFTAADERVQRACEYLFAELAPFPPVPASDSPARQADCCGLTAIPLRALASVGLAAEPRLVGAWAWLAHCQRADGGWLNPGHLADARNPKKTKGMWPWDRSCAWGSAFAVEALALSNLPRLRPALQRALEFQLDHLAEKNETEIQTWVYHGHSIVRELLLFSELGLDRSARPIPALLSWLRGLYQPEVGVFRAQPGPALPFAKQITAIMQAYRRRFGPDYWETIPRASLSVLRYRLYHLVEDDWLTYTLTRLGMNLL